MPNRYQNDNYRQVFIPRHAYPVPPYPYSHRAYPERPCPEGGNSINPYPCMHRLKVRFEECESIFQAAIKRFKLYLRDQCVGWWNNMRSALPHWMQPQLQEPSTYYTEVCNWMHAPIRRIVLHPSLPEKKALLKCDETVLYYQHCIEGQNTGNEVPRLLMTAEQRSICCGAFRPWSEPIQLAVGCALGVCLWDLPRHDDMNNFIWMQWIPCGKNHRSMDCVKELQWLLDGCYLACAVARAVQIWDTDTAELLQIFEMPQSESYMWMLRFKPDMQQLLNSLEDTGYECPSITLLDTLLTQNLQLQSAVWTNCGNHLIFAAISDCRIFITSPRSQRKLYLHHNSPSWRTEVVLTLNCVECAGGFRYCTDPVAVAIDPCDVIVAIMFKRLPFVLLCQLSLRLGYPSQLKPLRFLDRQPQMPFEVYPTCMCFSSVQATGDCNLFVAWTNGEHLIETISPTPMPMVVERNDQEQMDVDMETASESESVSESGSEAESESGSEWESESEKVEMEDASAQFPEPRLRVVETSRGSCNSAIDK